jgi:hypothetical protein
VATAAKIKPAKADGKQEIAAQPASAAPQNASTKAAILAPFKQARLAIERGYLGPPEGEHGKVGRLVDETSQCESSTKRAILAANPTEKLTAFVSGFNEWQEKLCASATACYGELFQLAVSDRAQPDAPPADFASSFTHACLSTFLRVTALGGAEEAREIDSNGRVRWFVRHACGDYSDDYPSSYGLSAGQSVGFRLPQYLSGVWRVRSMLAQRAGHPKGYTVPPATDRLSIEETEKFILEKEQTLIKRVRDAIAEAHREALIDLGEIGTAVAWPSETGAVAVSLSQKNYTRPKTSKRSDKVCFRLGVIFRAIEAGKTGLDYCKFLDANGLTTPDSWRGDGCPESYFLAYQKVGRLGRLFQHRINTEHTRNGTLRSKLEREDPAELKRILDISRRPKP